LLGILHHAIWFSRDDIRVSLEVHQHLGQCAWRYGYHLDIKIRKCRNNRAAVSSDDLHWVGTLSNLDKSLLRWTAWQRIGWLGVDYQPVTGKRDH